MRVLVTDNCHPVLAEKLRAAGHEVVVCTNYDYASLLKEVEGYDALVVRSKIIIDRAFLERARHLRCIGRLGSGMDTIDVAYAEGLGIRCLNSPEGNRDAVGEHTTGLLLALFDKICAANNEVRKGMWHREENRGLEIKGKNIGIIGFGNMGAAFAQRLQGFECRILAYDKYRPVGYAPTYVEECTLEEIQKQADVISFHVPLTHETRYYLNEEFLSACRRPVFVVNTSRGAVVSTEALTLAMREGKVQGAALDVVEYEDMTKDGLALDALPADFRYLIESPRVVLTPHVAGWTVESKYKLAAFLADKMIEVLC
ncbi:MAG: NAD(P)-dependent oxidoreductase [Bacteroidales bacterium]|nr:NAD(P)-dependent oxidoreductase [Bacteroidales bacterium]